VSEARRAVDRGFDCCKLKVGIRSVEDDIERVRRVRDAVGSSVELRADANEAWTYEEAESALDAFADLGVSILEQPLPAGALEGHADLRAMSRGVSIALDEGLLEHGVDSICEADAADVVVLKPMALGGIDVARKVAAWLTELDITPLVTTTIDGVVARTGAVHLAAAIPDVPACGLATGELLAADLGRDPVLLEKGRRSSRRRRDSASRTSGVSDDSGPSRLADARSDRPPRGRDATADGAARYRDRRGVEFSRVRSSRRPRRVSPRVGRPRAK